jgi:hypothetical protein
MSINPVATNTWSGASSLTGTTATSATGAVEDSSQTVAVATASNVPQISTLARQLSEAAARAATRDAGASRSQLASLDKALKDKVAGDGYYANRASANAEVPKTDDPELLARAKQATEFVNGGGTKNPFAGLSREQLALIFYDEGDAFTLNERNAAYTEYAKQYAAWSSRVCAQAWNEQNTTGTFTNFYKACIAEYQAGSTIEQSSYHPNYVGRMEHYIQFWENGGRTETAGNDWEVSMKAWVDRLPNSIDDDGDYSEGDKLWGAASRAPNGLEIGSRQYDRNLGWGLTSKLDPAAASPGLAGNTAGLYSQNQLSADH